MMTMTTTSWEGRQPASAQTLKSSPWWVWVAAAGRQLDHRQRQKEEAELGRWQLPKEEAELGRC